MGPSPHPATETLERPPRFAPTIHPVDTAGKSFITPHAKLAALALALFVARLVWIAQIPDIDMDAYGHYGIACELTHHPWNLAAHWVWLPLYHYLLAAVVLAKGAFGFVRALSAAFIAVLPLCLYRYELGRENADRRVAALAAVACALASIPNLLGVSAQQESLFSVLILLAAWGIDAKRPALSGAALALACLIRYEAWGAAAVCAGQPVLAYLLGRWRVLREGSWLHVLFGKPLSWAVGLPAIAAIFGWLLVHRLVEGSWFAFLQELYRFTHVQREALSQGSTADALWFPIILPLTAFGPAVLLCPLGLRPALRTGFLVPLGVFAFLMMSYLGKGSLGGPRYYAALTPFMASCMAHGTFRLVRMREVLRYLVVASLLVTTATSFMALQRATAAHAADLHAAEQRMICN